MKDSFFFHYLFNLGSCVLYLRRCNHMDTMLMLSIDVMGLEMEKKAKEEGMDFFLKRIFHLHSR